MKSLYLIRHAHASNKKLNQLDVERPLNKEGETEAILMGGHLKEMGINFDFIICSPAKRTTQTAKVITNTVNFNKQNINFIDSIYESSTENLIQLINNLPSHTNSVALIGHNPSITHLVSYLTDNDIDYLPPCGIVKIDLEIDYWNELIQGIGLQKLFIYPKMF